MWEAALLVLSGKHVSNNAHFKGGRCEAAVFFLNPFGAVQSGFTARRSKLWSMLIYLHDRYLYIHGILGPRYETLQQQPLSTG